MSTFQPLDYYGLADQIIIANPVLTSKISKAADLMESEVSDLLVEVLKFLHLVGHSNQKLTPSHDVDLAWHEFILCTRYYMDFCNIHFGRYIHHHPGGMEEENDKQFRQTIKLYVLLLGTPPDNIWGPLATEMAESSDCGSCQSST